MIRKTLLVLLLLSGTASAANLTCTVPAAAVTRAVEMCEALRVSMRVNIANWSNNACSTEFLRRGLRNFDADFTQAMARETVKSAVSDTLVTFDTDYPAAVAAVVCGDGTVDTEFGEVCDDGNRISRDGCNGGCNALDDVCGDSIVDASETCDDGNRISGDGCNADCQVE